MCTTKRELQHHTTYQYPHNHISTDPYALSTDMSMLAQSPRSFDTTGFAHQLQDKDIRTAQALQALGQTSDLQDITARLIKPSTSGTKVNDVARIKDAATGKLVSDGQRFIPSGMYVTLTLHPSGVQEPRTRS
jgi:hypothetical protein